MIYRLNKGPTFELLYFSQIIKFFNTKNHTNIQMFFNFIHPCKKSYFLKISAHQLVLIFLGFSYDLFIAFKHKCVNNK